MDIVLGMVEGMICIISNKSKVWEEEVFPLQSMSKVKMGWSMFALDVSCLTSIFDLSNLKMTIQCFKSASFYYS